MQNIWRADCSKENTICGECRWNYIDIDASYRHVIVLLPLVIAPFFCFLPRMKYGFLNQLN